jgi:hypothetical protein
MRKFMLALLAAALALPFVAGSTSAHSTVQYDPPYNEYCGFYNSVTEPYGFNWVRSNTQAGARITGSAAKIVARALWPCTHGNSVYVSKSLLLVNVQGTDSGGTYNFIQAGIGKVHNQDGTTQCSGANAMTNDQTHFVYTPDNTSGNFCRAYWVDFDNDGTPDNPVNGATYWVTITQFNSPGGSNYWRTCIKDVGAGKTDCIDKARTTNDGGLAGNNAAWWGCEVGNKDNALGVPDYAAKPTMRESAYQKANVPGTWFYTEDSPINSPWHANPGRYHYTQSQAGLGESVECYTSG